MKSEIHPPYHLQAQIRCSCGNVIAVGSTKESMRVELCSACHPFFTGQQRLVDTAGRVDRFEAKRKAPELIKQAKKEAAIAQKTKKTEKISKKSAKKTVAKKKAPTAKKKTV